MDICDETAFLYRCNLTSNVNGYMYPHFFLLIKLCTLFGEVDDSDSEVNDEPVWNKDYYENVRI